ncbi:hypothetical protein D3Z36_16055 [Lachnospiraceae bacterium]|nr:hypothetical protein [Lachnospiraceae bacterium]
MDGALIRHYVILTVYSYRQAKTGMIINGQPDTYIDWENKNNKKFQNPFFSTDLCCERRVLEFLF